VVLSVDPPRRQRALVLPDLVRQQEIVLRKTLEAVDEETATDGIEGGPQRGGKLQIVIAMAGLVWTSKNNPIIGTPSDYPCSVRRMPS
jgi:hypothetical protein